MTVIPEVKRDLIGWILGRVISVVDRGFSSEENLRILQEQEETILPVNGLWLVRLQLEIALSHPGRFRAVRDNLEVKEIEVAW